jgi:Mg2+-importing ATPase
MLVFGAVSSVFDLLTFALLLKGFNTGAEEFRTGWFVESLLTELAVALVVRTHLPCYRSRPGRWLTIASLAVAAVALLMPYVPLSRRFGFVPLPPGLLAAAVAVDTGVRGGCGTDKEVVFWKWSVSVRGG